MQTNLSRFFAFFSLLISFVFSLHAAEKTEADPESTYPLNIRVLMEQEGSEWLGSYDNRVEAFLWKKIDENGINDDTSPVIFAADGSVWRQVHSSRLYGKPSPYFSGVIDTKLSPGEYRASIANSKVYQEWEGPPGSRGGGRSGHQDYETKVWYHEASGFGGPQHVYGWVLGDPIRIDGGEEKYEQKIRDEGVPASFTVTAPKDEAEKLNLRLFREDGFYLENGRASGDYGLPSKMSFSRLPLGKYRLCVFRGKLQGNLLPPNTDVFPVEITTDGPNDFSFAAEKSLASESPWSVRGTVRDADGKPIKDVSIRADTFFTGLHGELTTQTDENGNYVLPITPLDVFSGIDRNEETGLPAYGFRFQQLILTANEPLFGEKREKERSVQGDLLVVGDFAKPKEIDELKKRFAEEKFKTVFVEKGKPLQIDFVLEPRLKTWPETEDGIPPSFVYQPNLWVGKEKLDRRYEVYRKTVFSYTMNDVYKAAVELSDKVSVSLRFPKPEILVGEPMKFDYVVQNNSDTDIWITVGGDYRGSGRPTSFTMRAIQTDGDEEKTVYEIPVTMNMGGISHEEKIPADGGEYAFDLCLACWFKLEEPGEYRIDVARYLNPSLQGGSSFEKRSTAPSVLRAASAKLTVKAPDHEAFGKLIDELGEQKEIDKLVHIEDERVIPWLLKLAEENDNYYVKSSLAKFNDDRVLEVISRDIASNDDTKSHSAAVNLSRSKHPGAIDILLKHQEHPNYAVRLTVVQAARKMPKDVALEMLQKRFNDNGWEGNVGKEARRIYDEIKDDDPVEK